MSQASGVPDGRVRDLNGREVNPGGDYVLYWMTSFRRTRSNFALQRAVERAVEQGTGVIVLEALRSDYRWASDRFHRFIIDGMGDNAAALADRPGVTYLPYVERSIGEGRGLLGALAERASAIVTDDYPNFFIPRMLEVAARRVPVRLEAVDGNGLAPLRATEKSYPTAYTFRRYLQKSLPGFLESTPLRDPIEGLAGVPAPEIPGDVLDRWPTTDLAGKGKDFDLSHLPIDHSIEATDRTGGQSAALSALDTFLRERISRYADERNQPEEEVASGLSPWLHFGHISTHEILERLAEKEGWDTDLEDRPANGKRSGWWGMSEPAEAFLDELVTWRELGYNMAAIREDYREYDALPDWARETLADHVDDPREHTYSVEQFAAAETHDELWNAAQRQLVREGVIHNYLRMLWGKKILEWTSTPREAAEVMIELNTRYALDGRDPNSYSGIYWCLGRYDRPWGPERPIFGKIRYMTSKNTARKLRVNEYLERYSG
ncbi:MAG: deoxyribodipyrimidine photolyase [Gemmatimonadota bacterium]